METASIRLICFYDGDLINENKNAEYVGGKKKLSKVSKTIGFKEFKEKIQAMLGLQPDDTEFTIKCRVCLDKEIQIAIDVDDDESLSSILDESEYIMAYIIKQQPSVINNHQREANGLRNVEKETIGGGDGVDPPNEMDPRGNCLQSMEQPLLPSSTDVNLHGSSNFEPYVNYDTSNQTPLHENIDLAKGQEFPDADAFRHALSDLAIRKNFEYKPVKTNKSRLTMKCKSPECKWRIVAGVKDCNLPAFKVIKICKQHSCPVRQRGGDHDQATIKWIAAKIQSDIKKNRHMTPSEIITTISKKFDIQISYNKAAKAKTKAMKEVTPSPFEECLEVAPGPITEILNVEEVGEETSEEREVAGGESFTPLEMCAPSSSRRITGPIILKSKLWESEPFEAPMLSASELLKEVKVADLSEELRRYLNDSEWLPDEASIPFEESYQYLPGLIKQLEKSGCVTKLGCDKENRFLYFFWAFSQCVHALHAHLCPPLIQIQSKRIQSGVLMTANGIINMSRLYLGFAIFKEEEEDEVCWETFLMLLKEFILADVHLRLPFAIVTEFGRKTTVSLVSKVFPEVHHVFYLQCLYEDFWDKFKDDNLDLLMLEAAVMFNVSDCDRVLNKIKEKNEDAYQWLLDAGKSHWSKAYFAVGYDFNCTSYRGNWGLECFTKDIKHLPIAAAVIHIIKNVAKGFFEEQARAATLAPTNLTPWSGNWVDEALCGSHLFQVASLGINAEEYHAFYVTESHHFTVNLKTITCDCREFQVRGVPCKHAAAVINQLDLKIEDYCKHWHKNEAIRAIYAEDFHPLANHSEDWQPPEDNEPRILPPKKKVGRPGNLAFFLQRRK